jgi:hypothetical protein
MRGAEQHWMPAPPVVARLHGSGGIIGSLQHGSHTPGTDARLVGQQHHDTLMAGQQRMCQGAPQRRAHPFGPPVVDGHGRVDAVDRARRPARMRHHDPIRHTRRRKHTHRAVHHAHPADWRESLETTEPAADTSGKDDPDDLMWLHESGPSPVSVR